MLLKMFIFWYFLPLSGICHLNVWEDTYSSWTIIKNWDYIFELPFTLFLPLLLPAVSHLNSRILFHTFTLRWEKLSSYSTTSCKPTHHEHASPTTVSVVNKNLSSSMYSSLLANILPSDLFCYRPALKKPEFPKQCRIRIWFDDTVPFRTSTHPYDETLLLHLPAVSIDNKPDSILEIAWGSTKCNWETFCV